jgi:CheY-like chemotaxis protein
LLNAAHAIPEGRTDGEIVISASVQSDEVVIEISDNGHGIEPDLLPRIFEPFVTTKSGGAGVGLGLSICQDIVLRWGGTIDASSVVGKGTTLRVTLPVASAVRSVDVSALVRGDGAPALFGRSSTPAPVPASSVRPIGRRRRVLVIDDEPLTVSMALAALRETHEVVGETDPSTGLDRILGEATFDLILCDLMMPGLTGMDIYERVARERPGLEQQIVFVSGGAYTDRARSFLKSIPNRHLLKPISAAHLASLVAAE